MKNKNYFNSSVLKSLLLFLLIINFSFSVFAILSDTGNQDQVVVSDIEKYNYECENKKAIETCSDGSYWIKTNVKANDGIYHPHIYCTANKQYHTGIGNYNCEMPSLIQAQDNQIAKTDHELYNYECQNNQKFKSCSDGSYWIKTYIKDTKGNYHSFIYCSSQGQWKSLESEVKCPIENEKENKENTISDITIQIPDYIDKHEKIYNDACQNNQVIETCLEGYWVQTNNILDPLGKCHPITFCNKDGSLYTTNSNPPCALPIKYVGCDIDTNEKLYDNQCKIKYDKKLKDCKNNGYWIQTNDIKDSYNKCHPLTYCNSDKTWFKGSILDVSFLCQIPEKFEGCQLNSCQPILCTIGPPPLSNHSCYNYYQAGCPSDYSMSNSLITDPSNGLINLVSMYNYNSKKDSSKNQKKLVIDNNPNDILID